jgi:hypothetical protein
MKAMKRIYVITLVIACVALWAGTSWSRSLEVGESQVAVIKPSAESSEARLLVQFTLPEILAGYSIGFACISFGADCAGDEGRVSFQVFPVSRAWDARTVSWANPWDKAGGDWNARLSAYGISEAGSGKTVELDVTDFANGWLKEPSKNFGVLVKVSGPFFGTFSLNGVQAPKLRILY